jgi:CheY-like chemotaxis protein
VRALVHGGGRVISMKTVEQSQKTVLLVDGHARLRRKIGDVLREAGYAVQEAASAADGLRMAERHQPDGVLVDLAMPGRPGLELLEELRQRDPTRDIRVIFASPYALAVLGDLAQGTDQPLHKPFDLADMLAKVQRVVLDFPTAADTEPSSGCHLESHASVTQRQLRERYTA